MHSLTHQHPCGLMSIPPFQSALLLRVTCDVCSSQCCMSFSWRDRTKHLFAPHGALTTDQNNHATQI